MYDDNFEQWLLRLADYIMAVYHCPYCGEKLEVPKLETPYADRCCLTCVRFKYCHSDDYCHLWGPRQEVLKPEFDVKAYKEAADSFDKWWKAFTHELLERTDRLILGEDYVPPDVKIEVSTERLERWAMRIRDIVPIDFLGDPYRKINDLVAEIDRVIHGND